MTRARELWQRVAKSAVMYVVFVITGYICMFTIRTDVDQVQEFWNQQLYGAVDFLYMLLMLFSLLGVFLVHDFPYRNRFFAYCKENKVSEMSGTAVKHLLRSAELWIDAASLAVFTLILPAGAYFEFRLGFLEDVSEQWNMVIFLAVMIPVEILLTVSAHISTLSWWTRPKVRRYEESRIKQVTDWIGQTLLSGVIYVVGALSLVFVVPVMYTAFLTAWVFATTLTVVAVILVIYLIFGKYVRVIFCRRSFMKKLRKLCKKQGLRLRGERYVYRSVFSAKEGSNLTLDMGGVAYVCKLITPLKKKVPIYFSENGVVSFVRRVYIADHYRNEEYFFDGESEGKSKRILIVNPGATRIYATDGIHHRELHSGDRVMGYEIYRTENFLSAVKRQYLGK